MVPAKRRNPAPGGNRRGAKRFTHDHGQYFIPAAVWEQAAPHCPSIAHALPEAAFYRLYPDRLYRVRVATLDEFRRIGTGDDEGLLFVAVLRDGDQGYWLHFFVGWVQLAAMENEAICRDIFEATLGRFRRRALQ
jgi:hypothetical protein